MHKYAGASWFTDGRLAEVAWKQFSVCLLEASEMHRGLGVMFAGFGQLGT